MADPDLHVEQRYPHDGRPRPQSFPPGNCYSPGFSTSATILLRLSVPFAPTPTHRPAPKAGKTAHRRNASSASTAGERDFASAIIAARTAGSASPNFDARYFSTLRRHWRLILAHGAQAVLRVQHRHRPTEQRDREHARGLRLVRPLPPHRLGRWARRCRAAQPSDCAVRPATLLPSVSASSGSNPNRSATTAAHNVSTGARLIITVSIARTSTPNPS